ncbi:hypothetical protein MG293_010314 [Ovis ammon polii]|uniref:Uncharacterized protein n=1 Tax=Ovis ammon polii TaxID=230172 RepID=A0AAD4Y9Q0_OVIAM|nr:hypothetical protein MG293_010314 [Ovis ammon polii]
MLPTARLPGSRVALGPLSPPKWGPDLLSEQPPSVIQELQQEARSALKRAQVDKLAYINLEMKSGELEASGFSRARWVRKQAQGRAVTSWGFWFREAGSSLETAPALETDLPALVTYLLTDSINPEVVPRRQESDGKYRCHMRKRGHAGRMSFACNSPPGPGGSRSQKWRPSLTPAPFMHSAPPCVQPGCLCLSLEGSTPLGSHSPILHQALGPTEPTGTHRQIHSEQLNVKRDPEGVSTEAVGAQEDRGMGKPSRSKDSTPTGSTSSFPLRATNQDLGNPAAGQLRWALGNKPLCSLTPCPASREITGVHARALGPAGDPDSHSFLCLGLRP